MNKSGSENSTPKRPTPEEAKTEPKCKESGSKTSGKNAIQELFKNIKQKKEEQKKTNPDPKPDPEVITLMEEDENFDGKQAEKKE